MSLEPVKYFASLMISSALVIAPLPAAAGGMSHVRGNTGHTTMPSCKNKPVTRNYHPNYTHHIDVNKPASINRNIDVNKNKNIDVNKNKNINDNKNLNINTNINDNKNININKNINDNKNININKNIVINNGGSADASAIASAVAEASANSSSNASVNFYGGVSSGAVAYGGGSGIPESPGPYAGGDIGALAVDVAEHPQQCVFQDSTVVKAIHAVCVSADGHEFPASHMVGQTWIESGYEGEVARCIPGAHLKVVIGEVVQSNQGMASSYSNGQVLNCALHEAVRHYKDGMLKCAPAVPVPDCTERTNLRKYGTGDMFFSYRAKVCVQTHQEYSENESREESRVYSSTEPHASESPPAN